ncbi:MULTISPECIES: triose-phosphate isomerase [unclassified Mesorhizobium]|uniref:triose-phosphate isomerase n=1 Tax=unclassified Mesorhizobium TaxID=325217 RepID=UPI000BAE9060|nr:MULTISPECIES: triose-phosphate isomerase [unclassified Mesorhizobium]TGT59885.1 triose-phosphate isomerase [Mesorhizobium sp. M00.F.Ca.ET.170.01.1.1]AZO08041.1 triose-phosphate isomerase [Mesorhizobium sp. M3A.F.Ca.ET.080.04.2.1]PBB87008.1 triose-phosphate isomerase [Mesorhizobium sp. WSM3876]RWB70320.1 MAG: triose-phosphate isomerase [Mesorhizobium sp.]RWB91383.1 MAG: triose-phosphate isomerase [Mesorhizobium sp.]
MTPGIRPLVAGNWKMNGTSASLNELRMIGNGFMSGLDAETESLVCVPATLLHQAAEILSRTPVRAGGEDCHSKESGAFTGEISAEMLKDAGASHVIVGHSERREQFGEDDATVHAKASAAWRAGLTAIICIGETRAEREAGSTLEVLSRQLAGSVPPSATAANTVVAYEPVWAIGTGLTPTAADVAEAHAHIRAKLAELLGDTATKMRILYGGSVKPSNAAELLGVENVDGALVGGASLKASDFLAIAEAYMHLS